MTVIVSIYRGGHAILTASVTDAELVAELKLIAQKKGYRVEVKEAKQFEVKKP